VFISKREAKVGCHEIEISVNDSLKNRFIVKNDILKLLTRKNTQIIGYTLGEINTKKLEGLIETFPSVEKADVYKTIDGKLEIEVKQRDPILRVINNRNESYYIDYDGGIMPLSGKYTSHVLIANGNISEHYNLSALSRSGAKKKVIPNAQKSLLRDLYFLAKYIYDDDFWSAQVEQIYVNTNHEFELVPRVGDQVILLGNIEDMDEKFKKLEIFYKEGLKYSGWNMYSVINLKYKNQVVCTKRNSND
jgi:cell division protein FtsQ